VTLLERGRGPFARCWLERTRSDTLRQRASHRSSSALLPRSRLCRVVDGHRLGLQAGRGILILPYPVGWLMALGGGVAGLVRFFKAKGQVADP